MSPTHSFMAVVCFLIYSCNLVGDLRWDSELMMRKPIPPKCLLLIKPNVHFGLTVLQLLFTKIRDVFKVGMSIDR